MKEAQTTRAWLQTRGALVALAVIDAALALTMRYSRTQAIKNSSSDYIITTAVVCAELIKLVSSGILAIVEGIHPMELLLQVLNRGSLTMAVPAVLYAIQNNLQYWAASLLDAPVYQVMYQFKIVTTAVCSVLLLGKELSCKQWSALFLCMVGTSSVQLSMLFQDNDAAAFGPKSTIPLAGLAAVLSACTTSALASVYTEMVLKQGDVSMWVRNFQLAFYCLVSASCASFWKDGEEIFNRGFFAGYTPVVWAVIGLVSCGGLVVAVVTRYTDSVIKNLAPACSIILSCTVSFGLFNFIPSPMYIFGAVCTLFSVWMYVNGQHRVDEGPLATQTKGSKTKWCKPATIQRVLCAFAIAFLFCGLVKARHIFTLETLGMGPRVLFHLE